MLDELNLYFLKSFTQIFKKPTKFNKEMIMFLAYLKM